MVRHSFLDSILNRPSQTYSEQPASSSSRPNDHPIRGNGNAKGGGSGPQWAAPSDLPNVPRAPSSIMSGSFFGNSRNKEARSAPTTSRFGRKKQRDSVMPGHYDFAGNNNDEGSRRAGGGGVSEIGSVADSNITASRRKGRWWEVGSLRGGRSGKPSSIAGESIFSEPEPPGRSNTRSWAMSQSQQNKSPHLQHHTSYQSMAGAMGHGRTSRSEYGGDASGPASRTKGMRAASDAPPVPSLSGRPSATGLADVKTGVAPLGQSSPQLLSQVPLAGGANGGVKKKSSKQRLSYQPAIAPLPHSSPPPAPSSVASSQHSQRPFSPVQSGSTRALPQLEGGAATQGASSADWKNFVQSMSGSEVAKAWQGLRDAPSMKEAASKTGTANMQRRRSAVERLQRELQADAIQEQAMREPGVIHQDLLARAASQVVGGTPEMDGSAYGLPSGNLRPGSVIVPPSQQQHIQQYMQERPQSPQAYATATGSPQIASQASLHGGEMPTPPGAFKAEEADPAMSGKRDAKDDVKNMGHNSDGEDDDNNDDHEGDDDDESEEEEDEEEEEEEEDSRDQPTLDVLNEEDEESSSSVGHEMYPRSAIANKSTRLEGRHRAFEAALRKSGQFSPEGRELTSGDPQEATDKAPAIAIQASSPRMPFVDGFKTPEEDGVVPKTAGGIESTSPTMSEDVGAAAAEEEPETPDGNKVGGVPPHDDVQAERDSETEAGVEDQKPVKEEEAEEQVSETESARSVDTGRAPTVTFDKTMEGKDADSSDRDTSKRAPSLRSNSRPPTLSRRLSDVSLGATSFGMSAIIRNGGRASRSSSSRRVKVGDDDSDSGGEKSDEDVELRAKAEAEQQRLRSMKVGDDFFGGSLSSILDKFDKTDWDARSLALTNQLDLNVGAPSSSSTNRPTSRSGLLQDKALTAQEMLSQNAQERVSEVRRLRQEESAKPSASGAVAETKSIDSKVSGMAHSFAAAWLLGQNLAPEEGSKDDPEMEVLETEPVPSQSTSSFKSSSLGHGRQPSGSSDSSFKPASTGSRLRNFFGGGSNSSLMATATAAANTSGGSNESPEKKQRQSVLDRPRHRAPKPQEMAGLAISQGKLKAEAPKGKEVEEDTRSTLPSLFSSPSKLGSSSAAPASSSSISSRAARSDSIGSSVPSPPSSPAKPNIPMSRDKPAPAKSALKGGVKPSRSLADTLFSFPSEKKASESKNKTAKAATTSGGAKSLTPSASASASMAAPSSINNSSGDGIPPPSAWGAKKAKKVAKLESKSQTPQAQNKAALAKGAAPQVESQPQSVEEVPPPEVKETPQVTESISEPDQKQEITPKAALEINQKMSGVAPVTAPIAATESANKDESNLTNSKRFVTARELADGQETGHMPTFDSFATFALPELSNPEPAPKTEADKSGAGAGVADEEEEESDSEEEWQAEQEYFDSQTESDEDNEEETKAVHTDQGRTSDAAAAAAAAAATMAPARSPQPPSSEIDSVASTTGPATPNATETLDRVLPLAARRNDSPGRNASVLPEAAIDLDKKLPMPPPPSFEGQVDQYHDANDATPLAAPRHEPLYSQDTNATPMAEMREPTFGMKLIPPTPPALESRNSYTSASRPPSGGAAEPLLEQPQQDSSDASMQRSTSVRASKPNSTTTPKNSALVRSKSTSSPSATAPASSSKRRSAAMASGFEEYKGQGLSLPPGLIATTVARSDSTVKRKKSKGKGKRASESHDEEPREKLPSTTDAAKVERRLSQSSIRSSSALSSLADAPPVPAIPSSATESHIRTLPPHLTTHSETNSSAGDSSPHSRSISPSPSPAPSASGRSSVVSSSVASGSVVSDHSSSSYRNNHLSTGGAGVPYQRKIRTLSAGPGGQAQTSMMSAINEWESSANSPVDLSRSGATSPVSFAGGHHAAHFPSFHPSQSAASRSASSVYVGNTPSFVRNAPLGASTDSYLQPPDSGSAPPRQISSPRSVDGHMWASGANESNASLHQYSQRESISNASSGLGAPASVASSMPSVPRSSYRPQDPIKSANTIDDRLYARTTMSTVAVTSGAFRQKDGALRGRSMSIKSKKGSASDAGHGGGAPASSSGHRSSIDSQNQRDEMLQEELSKTTMALTSHTPPPRKLNSTSLLVQVIAVAIDDIDRLILREKVRADTSAYGFVPGRSFCGRVMEVGWEVKRMRKGDIVFGLQDSKKSGALAEFMTVEQDLVAKAPEDCLTIEQIAALPSTGVMAYQIMTNHCSQLPRGARCLILNAHDGIGLLTMQESSSLGLIIVAQCPPSVSDGLAVCEANGAHEVVIGEPLWALNSLHESSFDLVIDTVGGRRIYDGARRILATNGQFVTCFGDDEHGGMAAIIANPTLKAHLRSLRRSFFKKDKKHIGYEWIAMDLVGGDSAECRDALEAVKKAAEAGRVVPRIKSILGFADGPRAFEGVGRVGGGHRDEESGAVVVRVS